MTRASARGRGMIAGTVVVFGAVGAGAGLWSKRGSIVALGAVTPPATYRYACTYQPIASAPDAQPARSAGTACRSSGRHLTGFYRRYSGDLAELGKGEILAWTAVTTCSRCG